MHPAIILLMLSDISNKNFPDITKSFDYINQTFNSSVYNNAKDEIITYVFSLVFAEMLNTYFNTPLSWQNILTKLLDYKIKDENVFKIKLSLESQQTFDGNIKTVKDSIYKQINRSFVDNGKIILLSTILTIKSTLTDINNIKLSDYVKLSKDLSLPKKLQEFYKNLETIKETPEYKDKMKLYSKYFKEKSNMTYKQKYLKYKQKYLKLKSTS